MSLTLLRLRYNLLTSTSFGTLINHARARKFPQR
jgi:hypothetical protein